MRPTGWFGVGWVLVAAIGCGVSSDSDQPQADSGAPTAMNTAAAGQQRPASPTGENGAGMDQRGDEATPRLRPQTLAPAADASPEEVVRWFLEATRRGDDQIAAAMLSRRAIEETTKRGLSVQPPGSPTMKYTIDQAEKAPNEGAYVKCLWTESVGESVQEVEVVWVLAPREPGWRITGMAAQLSPDADPIFIDFENPEGLAERVGGRVNTEGVAETANEPPLESPSFEEPPSKAPPAYNAQQPGAPVRR